MLYPFRKYQAPVHALTAIAVALIMLSPLAAGADVPPPTAAVASPSPASDAQRSATNLADFDFMVQKITTNYAGWDTKVTDANRAELAALTARLRARAATARDDEMPALLGEWVGFFHDGHTGIRAVSF